MLTVNEWTLSPFSAAAGALNGAAMSNPEIATTRKRQRQLRHAASKENMVRELTKQQLHIKQLMLQNQQRQASLQLENASLINNLPTLNHTHGLEHSNRVLEFPVFPSASILSRAIPVTPVKVANGNTFLKKEKPKKSVSFSKETKTWDGLLAIHDDFDELLYCFLIKGQSIGDGDILKWTSEDCFKIFSLAKLLNNLICRVRVVSKDESNGELSLKARRTKQVPCLPRGGGRAMRVEKAYEPYLVSLLSVLATALSIATTNTAQKNLNKICGAGNLELMQHLVKNKAALEGLVHCK